MSCDVGKWSEVKAARNGTHCYVSVNGQQTVTMVTGMMSYLDVTSDFFIGEIIISVYSL